MRILLTILLGSVKFGMTFPIAIFEFGFSFFETILWINIGGLAGVFFFAYLSEYINRWWNRTVRGRIRRNARKRPKKTKRIFTSRNRRIIRIKQRYGLAGIAFATPVLFSIPIGVFLVVHYYHSRPYKLIWMLGSNLVWSFLYTAFYTFCYQLFR
ncbi:MAG: hypothetical protein ACOYXB_06170 [Bacteroidota bacterium]